MLSKHTEIKNYMHRYSSKTHPLLSQLEEFTYEHMDFPQMLSGSEVGHFLKYHIKLTKAKNILEIGTFTAYATLSMAEALCSDGKIISMDVDPKAHKVAKDFVNKSPWRDRMELLCGDACELIKTVDGPFDLVFIDADKKNYLNYYKMLVNKLKKGGFFIFDNALWSGEVCAPKDLSAQSIHELNEYLARDERVENHIFSIRDGVHVAQKI